MRVRRQVRWCVPILLILLLAFTSSAALAYPSPDGEPLARAVYPQDEAPDEGGGEIAVEVKPIADTVYLENIRHEYQGWNNCGPTTTSMYLSYYGINAPQTITAPVLKPNSRDVNVSPDQVANYIRSQGLEALVRVNGNRDTIMWFLSNGIPVMAEQWLPDDGGMGHYRLATGFNRARGTVTFDDSLLGPDGRWTWAQWEARWSEFNTSRIYILVYRPEQAPLVRALLGPDADDVQMWQRAEAGARSNLEVFSDDGRVWFSLGDALLNQGRTDEALDAYEKAYALGLPWRYYWYQFGHYEALARLGRWQRLLELTQPVLARAPMHEEMYYYQGVAYKGLGNVEAARQSFNQALTNNRNFARARASLQALN
jgi:hypothetical protein